MKYVCKKLFNKPIFKFLTPDSLGVKPDLSHRKFSTLSLAIPAVTGLAFDAFTIIGIRFGALHILTTVHTGATISNKISVSAPTLAYFGIPL